MNKQTENYCYSLGFEFGNYQAKETLIIKDVELEELPDYLKEKDSNTC